MDQNQMFVVKKETFENKEVDKELTNDLETLKFKNKGRTIM